MGSRRRSSEGTTYIRTSRPMKPTQTGKKQPETPRKTRARQPSTSEEENIDEPQRTASVEIGPREGCTSEVTLPHQELAQLASAVAQISAANMPHTPCRQTQRPMPPDSASHRHLQSPAPDQELDWEELIEGISAGPVTELEEDAKILRLAREVKRLASLMTAGRDLHDIQTTLHLVAHWPHLQQTSRHYAQHRLRLFYSFVIVFISHPVCVNVAHFFTFLVFLLIFILLIYVFSNFMCICIFIIMHDCFCGF